MHSYRKKINYALAFTLVSLTIQLMVSIAMVRYPGEIKISFTILSKALQKINIDIPENFFFIEMKFGFLVGYIFAFYPLSILILLYSMIAWHLKIILNNFLDELNSYVSYRKIFQMYDNISRLIHTADATLGSLAFKTIIFVSVYLYFGFFFLMSSRASFDYNGINTLYTVVFVLSLLFVMIYNAAGICEINNEIHETVLRLPHDIPEAQDKIFLVMMSQKDLGLSVGGMVIMKKGVFPHINWSNM